MSFFLIILVKLALYNSYSCIRVCACVRACVHSRINLDRFVLSFVVIVNSTLFRFSGFALLLLVSLFIVFVFFCFTSLRERCEK